MSHHLPGRKMSISEFCRPGQVIHQGFFLLSDMPCSGTPAALPIRFSWFTGTLPVLRVSLGRRLYKGRCDKLLARHGLLQTQSPGLVWNIDIVLGGALPRLSSWPVWKRDFKTWQSVSFQSISGKNYTTPKFFFKGTPNGDTIQAVRFSVLWQGTEWKFYSWQGNPHLSSREPLNLERIILSPSSLYQNWHVLLHWSPCSWIASHVLDAQWYCYCRKISSSVPSLGSFL